MIPLGFRGHPGWLALHSQNWTGLYIEFCKLMWIFQQEVLDCSCCVFIWEHDEIPFWLNTFFVPNIKVYQKNWIWTKFWQIYRSDSCLSKDQFVFLTYVMEIGSAHVFPSASSLILYLLLAFIFTYCKYSHAVGKLTTLHRRVTVIAWAILEWWEPKFNSCVSN